MSLASQDQSITGELTIYENRLATQDFVVELNGEVVARGNQLAGYVFQGLRDGDQLRFLAIPEPAAVSLIGCVAIAVCCCRRPAEFRTDE